VHSAKGVDGDLIMKHEPQPSHNNDEFDQLLMQQVDGELSRSEMERLALLLRDDSQKQEQYARYIALHAWLDWDRTDVAPASPEATSGARGRIWRLTSRVVHFFAHPTPLSWTIAALFMVALTTAMAMIVPPVYQAMTQRVEPSHEVVAQLTGMHEAVWAEGQIGATEGAHLVSGHRMVLKSGFAEVVFRRGARVVLEGPAEFVPLTTNQGSLVEGKLAARVNTSAKGFRILTPRGTVTDLGTEFAVEVQPNGNEQVHVVEGLVEVQWGTSTEPTGNVTRLSAGQALDWSNERLATPLPAAPQRFALRLPLPEPLVRWTFDNDSAARPEVSLHGGATVRDGRLQLTDGNDNIVVHDRQEQPLNVESYTLSVWVRCTEAKAQNLFVRTSDEGTLLSFSHQLLMDADGHFVHYTFDGQSRWLVGTTPVVPGQWHHVAITAASSGPMSLYVNGRREAHYAQPLGRIWDRGNRFQLGGPAKYWKTGETLPGLDGELTDFAMFDKILSPRAIGELAQQAPGQPRSDSSE
jgi:hypothetical protein